MEGESGVEEIGSKEREGRGVLGVFWGDEGEDSGREGSCKKISGNETSSGVREVEDLALYLVLCSRLSCLLISLASLFVNFLALAS